VKTRNLNIENFLNNNCETLDNRLLVALLCDNSATITSAYAGKGNDETVLLDSKVWIKG